MQLPKLDVSVDCAHDTKGLPAALVRRVVCSVLDGQKVETAEYSVAFVSGQKMRALNRRSFGHDRATDVIAFSLPHQGMVVGDIYVCPSVARRTARELEVPEREELVRLVVHGTLHTLGFDHPPGRGRCHSDMWQLQEHYVMNILGVDA